MDQRVIIEMGMGNDLHGMDYQKAARRAIEDAIRHSTLPIFQSINLAHTEMRVQVTVAVQEPEKIDTAVKPKLPKPRNFSSILPSWKQKPAIIILSERPNRHTSSKCRLQFVQWITLCSQSIE